jgi:hypothetical protein
MKKINSFLTFIVSHFLGDSRLLLFLLILTEVSFILLTTSISFETSDERVMNLIASGGYTGMPSERLIFMNLVIGYLLKFLYTYFPILNWYTWFLLSTLTFSFFAFQHVINVRNKDIKLKLLIHIVLLCVVSPLLVKICFTKIAAFSIISGLIVIVYNSYSRSSIFIGYCLILLGVAIRMEVFFMLLLFIFPIYLYLIFQKKYIILLHPTVAFVFGVLLSAFHYFNYRNQDDWKYYTSINYLRSRITTYDNPNFEYEKVKDRLVAANWTKTDYDFVSKFYFDLGITKFNPEALKTITSSSKVEKDNLKIYYIVNSLFKNFKKFIGFITHNPFSIVVFCGMLILIYNRKWKIIVQIVLFVVYCFLLINTFEIFFNGNYTKQRLLWVILYSTFGFILYHSIKILVAEKSKTVFMYLSISSLILLVIPNSFLNSRPISNGYELQKYIEKKSDRLYVTWPSMEQLDVFEIPIYYKNAYFLGWLQGSPMNKEKLRSNFKKPMEGIYQSKGTYDWYFIENPDDLMTTANLKLVIEFYKTNFINVTLKTDKYLTPKYGTYWKLKITFDEFNRN